MGYRKNAKHLVAEALAHKINASEVHDHMTKLVQANSDPPRLGT